MFENYSQLFHAVSGSCGYTMYGVTQDGGVLCEPCMHSEHHNIGAALEAKDDPQWEVQDIDIHWEGDPLQCDHCHKQIDPSYD